MDTKDRPDVLVIDLDTLREGADNGTPHGPIRLTQLILDDGSEGFQLGPVRRGARRLQAALIFLRDVGRVLEQLAVLTPDRRVELLDRNAPCVALALTVEAVTLRPGAAVVVVSTSRRAWIARLPAATIRVAALLADQQTLQEIADTFDVLAVSSPALL